MKKGLAIGISFLLILLFTVCTGCKKADEPAPEKKAVEAPVPPIPENKPSETSTAPEAPEKIPAKVQENKSATKENKAEPENLGKTDKKAVMPPKIEKASPKVSLAFADATTKMEFVYIKGGCYQMGDSFGVGYSNERPVHEVCLNNFYLGKYEVTQGQWKKIMGNNPSVFNDCGDNCPVERVSWNDVQDFIRKLNQITGKKYRLPTEAEWEYAARSGGKKELWAGTSSDSELDGYAWYRDNSGRKIHSVGLKKPNGLGLYDMTGNVWEWTSDWFDENYYKESPRNNPTGPNSGQFKVLRGGSWKSERGDIITLRNVLTPESRSNNGNGFRLAMPVSSE